MRASAAHRSRGVFMCATLIVATVCAAATAAALPVLPGGSVYTALTPFRILDSRNGTGGVVGALGAGATASVTVLGVGGVPPAGVTAVALNVTVTQPTSAGFLTVWPDGVDRPLASNLNFAAGETIPNLVIAGVGANGRVAMYNSAGASHVIADIVGWYGSPATAPTGAAFTSLSPSRILDTRTMVGNVGHKVGAGETIDLAVLGVGGVASTTNVTAVVLNVTVTEPTGTGFITVWPSGVARPLASSLNFRPGQTIPNVVIATVGSNGKVSFYNSGGASHLVADVVGWYGITTSIPNGTVYHPVVPSRALDTRDGTGFSGPLPQASSGTLAIAGHNGVPADGVSGVVLNVTVTEPTSSGFVSVWPAGLDRPLASSLNFVPGQTIPNLVVTAVGEGGRISMFNSAGSSHLVADVVGWFGPGSVALQGNRSVSDRPDDVIGFQVHAIYALPSDGVDRAFDTDGTIARSLESVQTWLAAQSGGTTLALDTFGGTPDVSFVAIPRTDASIASWKLFARDALEHHVRNLGFEDPFKIYAIYYEGSNPVTCGGGAWPPELIGPAAAMYVGGCGAGLGTSTTVPTYPDIAMLHELFHTLGAAPRCSLHPTVDFAHVSDDPRDLMYAGPLPWDVAHMQLDVGRDDYWATGRTDCLDVSTSIFLSPRPNGARPPPGWGQLPQSDGSRYDAAAAP